MSISRFSIQAFSQIQSALLRVRKDTSGLAAVEFAMVLPVMLGVYFGSAEVTKGVLASRKITLSARVMSDLLGQQNATVDVAMLDKIMGAAGPVIAPLTTANIKITLSSINFIPTANPAGYDARTDWSYASNSNPLRPCQVLTMVPNDAPPSPTSVPTGFYKKDGVVVADVTYNYPTPFNINVGFWQSPPMITFHRAMFFALRNSAAINSTGAGVTHCTYP